LNNIAWDYPADVIGFDTGTCVELNQPKWTLRYGFFPSAQHAEVVCTEDEHDLFTWPHNSFWTRWTVFSVPGQLVTEFERRVTRSKLIPGRFGLLLMVNRANMFSYSEGDFYSAGQRCGSGRYRGERPTAPNTALGLELGNRENYQKTLACFGRCEGLEWNGRRKKPGCLTDVDYTATLV